MPEPRLVLQVVDRTYDVQDEEIHPGVQIRVVTIAGLTKLSAEDCDRVAGIILSNEKKLSKAAITALKQMQNLREAQIHDTHVLASFFESGLIAPIVKLATSEKKVRFPQGRYPNLSELILNGRSVDFGFDPIQSKSLERLTISPSASQAKNLEFWDRVGDLLPENWTVLSWNFPFMIPCAGEGGFHEEKQVYGSADRVRVEAG